MKDYFRSIYRNTKHYITVYKKPWYWNLLFLFYTIIRPLSVKNVYIDEDYLCGECCRPVLTRVLFCSTECVETFEKRNVIKL